MDTATVAALREFYDATNGQFWNLNNGVRASQLEYPILTRHVG